MVSSDTLPRPTTQGDYITALKHFKTAAEGDNSYGHYNIALLYSDGRLRRGTPVILLLQFSFVRRIL